MAEATKTKQSKTKPATKPGKPRPGALPKFNVVLLNDDDHSYPYVIEMLFALFAHPPEKGFELAKEVDKRGRVIVLTTHKEMAELKRDQILAYGKDPRIEKCAGSMSAIIEPAPG